MKILAESIDTTDMSRTITTLIAGHDVASLLIGAK